MPQEITYTDIVQVFQSTDCPDATKVAQEWLDYLALRASGERLLTHAINRSLVYTARKGWHAQ